MVYNFPVKNSPIFLIKVVGMTRSFDRDVSFLSTVAGRFKKNDIFDIRVWDENVSKQDPFLAKIRQNIPKARATH